MMNVFCQLLKQLEMLRLQVILSIVKKGCLKLAAF